MSQLTTHDLDRVMHALPPQAQFVLRTMAQAQNRPVEDVLRDEIELYIAGRIPAVDLDGAMKAVQSTAYQAGYLIGRLRAFARQQSGD